jgi:hypothetical protein
MSGYRVVERQALSGDTYRLVEEVMPRISHHFLDSVVFLYPSQKAAEKGERVGGSGFLASLPYRQGEEIRHLHFVTNKHNLAHGAFWVRFNKKPTVAEIFKTDPKGWREDPHHDIAAYHFLPDPSWDVPSVTVETFLTLKDHLEKLSIGPGDDIFGVARLIGYEGREWNTPMVHFGSVSMADLEHPLRNRETDQWEPSFLVEMRARGGYSGSPVFGFIDPQRQPWLGGSLREPGQYTFLLGMVWSYVPTHWARLEKGKKTGEHFEVESNIAGVVPAWLIQNFLYSDRKLMEKRKEAEEAWDDENLPPAASPEPAFADAGIDGLEATAEVMGKLLKVPKEEADEVHRSHPKS